MKKKIFLLLKEAINCNGIFANVTLYLLSSDGNHSQLVFKEIYRFYIN